MKLFLLTLLLFCTFNTYSQKITVGKSATGSFIEFSENLGFTETKESYWITTSTVTSLQNAMAKAIEWSKLNASHRMSFEKDILRFRTMRKSDYDFYRKFIQQFTEEAIVKFEGESDGSFKCTIEFESGNLTFVDVETINNFIRILQGKSGNRPVDNIFH